MIRIELRTQNYFYIIDIFGNDEQFGVRTVGTNVIINNFVVIKVRGEGGEVENDDSIIFLSQSWVNSITISELDAVVQALEPFFNKRLKENRACVNEYVVLHDLYKLVSNGVLNDLRVRIETHLFQNTTAVGAYSFRADGQLVRDLTQSHTSGDVRQDLKFSVR